MILNVKHDSRDTLYRLPGGAMPAGGSLRIRIWSEASFKVVNLRLWTGSERIIRMREMGYYKSGIMYETELSLPDSAGLCWYYFIMNDGVRDYWYGNAFDHLGGLGQLYDYEPPSFQITVYDPAYMPPKWLREGVIYQIFPDRFNREDLTACGKLDLTAKKSESNPNAVKRPKYHSPAPVMHSNWYDKPALEIAANGDNAANDFYGGTLRGITSKLDYLKRLGVTIIYINPIFMAPSNHRYNCADYTVIDPMLGNEDDLRELCAEGKKRGIRILLDGVFSHTGDDSVYFNRYRTFKSAGACQGEESPYFSWYSFKSFPDKYKSWWDFDTLPEVNEDSDSFRRFICGGEETIKEKSEFKWAEGVIRHYMRDGISGWRLDVADELPMSFLRELRSAVKREDSDAAIIGEVWEDASNKEAYGNVRCYFEGDTLDSVMDYPLRDIAIDFFLGHITAGDFTRHYSSIAENYPQPVLYALMNLMGSHDRTRILNIMAGMDPSMPRNQQATAEVPEYMYGLAKRRVAAMWRLICALPGAPCIYYGDEAGCTGMNDPFNRGTFPWGREDEYLTNEYATAAKLHRESDLLRRGDVEVSALSDDLIMIKRSLTGGTDYSGERCDDGTMLILVNRSLENVTACIDFSYAPRLKTVRRQGDVYVLDIPALTTGYFE